MAEPSIVAESPLVGRRLGDFVVRELIGEGGYGQVYLAAQPLLDRQAVVKVLYRRHGTRESVIQRFLREARLASRIDHPYAAHIYAFGAEPDGLLWIAMERVGGVPLSQLIAEQGPVPLERFVGFLERLCEVVHTVHERGIVHSDLKPANVMVLSRAGRLLPKLLDLGIARDLDSLPPGDEAADGDSDDDAQGSAMAAKRTGERTGGYGRSGVQGSPHYMAPEQWYAPGLVDRRTDIYALGVLCFEALMGYPPFWGKTATSIARGHAKKPVPSLGDVFPPALDQVLETAMAKRQQQRYSSVIDLSTAFAEAAGIGGELSRLPELEPAVAQTWMTSAPQPLAEAVAMLDGARNAHHARETLHEVVELSAHYVGLLAVAGWNRAAAGESPPAIAASLVSDLAHGTLAAREWASLARELVRPFADKSDVYPMPELVLFFFASGRGDEDTTTAFDRLFELARAEPGVGSSDRELRDFLAPALAELSRHLRALSFLTEYPLVVPTGRVVEQWMGVRRARRPTLDGPRSRRADTPGDAASPGRTHWSASGLIPGNVMVTDVTGLPVLSLHPIMQVAPPVPGGQPELFLLDGPGRRGARMIARPRGFEHQDSQLWEWLRARFLSDIADQVKRSAIERAPYRGLSSFTSADADLYFGRESEAEMFGNRIQLQPLLAVVGPSGAGKSSFVHAGVVPILAGDWTVITVRPGATPSAELITRMSNSDLEVRWSELQDIVDIAAAVRDAIDKSGKRLLLVIDQFEELFTLCQDGDERADYVEILTRLASHAEAPIRVVLTLRDDFLMRAQSLPFLRDRLAHSLQLLTTPDTDDLLRILIEPAGRVGYSFEDERLPRQMVEEVGEHPSALALLSFAAAQLWELRDSSAKELRRVAYETMGGVGGALAHHADAVLAEMSADELLVVREAFRHLVTAQGTRAVLTRNEIDQLLGTGPHGEQVLEKLIAARLLVAQEGDDEDTEKIEITHEALITDWPQLAKWRREDAEGARMRDELRAAARMWDERNRASWLLWRGEALTEYQLWRARYPGAITDLEEQFAAVSLKQEARGRHLRQAALIGAFIVLAAGLVITLALANQAATERDRAEASEAKAHDRLVDLRVEQARQALVHGEPLHGLVYLREAMAQGADGPVVRYLLANGNRTLAAQKFSLTAGFPAVNQALYSDGDRRIVTAGGGEETAVWSAETGQRLYAYRGGAALLALSPSGDLLAVGGSDGAVRLWQASEPTLVFELDPPRAGPSWRVLVSCLEFSRDGKFLVAGKADKSVTLWDVATGAQTLRLPEHADRPLSCSFNRDASQVLTTGGEPRLWNARTGALIHTLGARQRQSYALYSPDGTRVLTHNLAEPTVRVWQAATGRLIVELQTRAMGVRRARYSADGKRIVIAGKNGTAQVWNAETGTRELVVHGHDGMCQSASLSPDGAHLVTTGNDRIAILWDAASGDRIATLHGHLAKVIDASFNAAGTQLLTAGEDGTARVWTTARSALLTEFRPGGEKAVERVVSAIFSPDGERILTYSRDRVVRLWNAASGQLLYTYESERHPVARERLRRLSTTRAVPSFDETGAIIAAPMGKTVRILDGYTLVPRGVVPGHTDMVSSAILSPDGRILVTTDIDGARVWSVESSTLVRILPGSKSLQAIADISPGGRLVAAAGFDQVARVWDLASGRLLEELRGHTAPVLALAFDASGDFLATASPDTTIRIWSVATGKTTVVLETGVPVFSVAFSPDGALVAAIQSTGQATIWDARRGMLLARLGSMAEFGYWVAFDPRGDRLALSDGSGSIWDTRRDQRPIIEVLDQLGDALPHVLVGDRILLKSSQALMKGK